MADSHYARLVERAARLLISNPLIAASAVGAWGWRFVEVVRPPYALFTTMIGWIFTAAFFGLVAQATVGKERLTWKSIGTNVKQFLLGTIIIIMAYTIPFLLIIPIVTTFIGNALQTNLEGNAVVLIIGFTPTVVPIVVATWSLVVRRSSLLDAIKDGVGLLRGRWSFALIVGLGYQLLAHGTQAIRGWLLPADTLLFIVFEAIWICVEAVMRLTVLLVFFSELHPSEDATEKKQA